MLEILEEASDRVDRGESFSFSLFGYSFILRKSQGMYRWICDHGTMASNYGSTAREALVKARYLAESISQIKSDQEVTNLMEALDLTNVMGNTFRADFLLTEYGFHGLEVPAGMYVSSKIRAPASKPPYIYNVGVYDGGRLSVARISVQDSPSVASRPIVTSSARVDRKMVERMSELVYLVNTEYRIWWERENERRRDHA